MDGPMPPHRRRMKRREVPGGVRFLTFSCEGRLPLLAAPGVADLFVTCLDRARIRVPVDLFAWVVMPEHVHLVVGCPVNGPPVARFLRFLKQAVSQRSILTLRRRDDPLLNGIMRDGAPCFWLPGGGFDRNVRDVDEFRREVLYTHMPGSRGRSGRSVSVEGGGTEHAKPCSVARR